MTVSNPRPTRRTALNLDPALRATLPSLVIAAAIALSARIAVPLPFTDVPVTGQVFAVLLAGGLLGPRWGVLAVTEYLVAGGAGAPVFAGAMFGPQVIFGPTGGYLAGFLVAAALVGWVADRRPSRGFLGVAMFMGAVSILMCGGLWRHFAFGHAWPEVFGLSVLPFIAVDCVKAIAAWAITCRVRRL